MNCLFKSDAAANASYLYLPDHPRSDACIANTVPLEQVLPGYQGPDVNLDFDQGGRLIGIEVMAA